MPLQSCHSSLRSRHKVPLHQAHSQRQQAGRVESTTRPCTVLAQVGAHEQLLLKWGCACCLEQVCAQAGRQGWV